jgi:hypothetical protein
VNTDVQILKKLTLHQRQGRRAVLIAVHCRKSVLQHMVLLLPNDSVHVKLQLLRQLCSHLSDVLCTTLACYMSGNETNKYKLRFFNNRLVGITKVAL